jgi:hypothetical protein
MRGSVRQRRCIAKTLCKLADDAWQRAGGLPGNRHGHPQGAQRVAKIDEITFKALQPSHGMSVSQLYLKFSVILRGSGFKLWHLRMTGLNDPIQPHHAPDPTMPEAR